MIFSTPTYVAFLCIVLAVLALSRSARFKRVFLLGASYVFYAWWDWRFTGLLLGLTALNYVAARIIRRQAVRRRARQILALTIVTDLGVLGLFKYARFFTESANHVLDAIGVRIPLLDVLLPVAISFITFEVISYVVDVYRKDLEPAPFLDVAMLVAFFPHLIAGPILKPRLFLPQVRRDIRLSRADVGAGVQLFALGLVKKVLIADRLAMFIDPVLAKPGTYDALTLWLVVLAYAVQIYADFSGYSDMAIGSARCMGFDIPPNFAAPYAVRNIAIFWRRWHISLSTWVRDYLYIPLGGNRRGPTRTAVNLFVVMVAVGLWHGAGWNFVLWGALHGAALVVHRLWSRSAVPRRSGVLRRLAPALSWGATFGFVTLAWVFFRVADLTEATDILMRMFGFADGTGIAWYATSALLLVPIALAYDALTSGLEGRVPVLQLGTVRGGFVIGSLGGSLLLFWPTYSAPFIYFQF